MPSPGLAIIPAVDILGTEAVRLQQGDYARVSVRAGDPGELVARLAEERPALIHVVDLDGARRGSIRRGLVAGLARRADPVPLQVGGGVRSLRDASALLDAGASRIVVGTAAFAHPDALNELTRAFGARLVVALDVRDNMIRVRGWTRCEGLGFEDAIARCRAAGVARLLCTAIARDGTLSGPDLPLLRRVVASSELPVVAAGGIRDAEDLRRLAEAGLEGAVVGRAIHARAPAS